VASAESTGLSGIGGSENGTLSGGVLFGEDERIPDGHPVSDSPENIRKRRPEYLMVWFKLCFPDKAKTRHPGRIRVRVNVSFPMGRA